MAQQTINSKDHTHGLVNSRSNLFSSDRQQHEAVKKMALRDLQNNNAMPTPNARAGTMTDTIKLSGTKRPNPPEGPLSPSCYQSVSINDKGHLFLHSFYRQQQETLKKTTLTDQQNNSAMLAPKNPERAGPTTDAINSSATMRPNLSEGPLSPSCHQFINISDKGNHVYMRRKSDQELVKSNTNDDTGNNTNNQLRQFSYGKQDIPCQPTQMQGSKVSSYPLYASKPMNSSFGGPSVELSLGKPVNTMLSTDLNQPSINPVINPAILPLNHQKTSKQPFNERFLKLKMSLKDPDDSSYEEYSQMLRSLSSADRSKHAVELEKRVIHLLLEEKKELQRMKALNILVKSSSEIDVSPSSMRLLLGNEKAPIGDGR